MFTHQVTCHLKRQIQNINRSKRSRLLFLHCRACPIPQSASTPCLFPETSHSVQGKPNPWAPFSPSPSQVWNCSRFLPQLTPCPPCAQKPQRPAATFHPKALGSCGHVTPKRAQNTGGHSAGHQSWLRSATHPSQMSSPAFLLPSLTNCPQDKTGGGVGFDRACYLQTARGEDSYRWMIFGKCDEIRN